MHVRVCICLITVSISLICCGLAPTALNTNWDNVENARPLLQRVSVGGNDYRAKVQAEYQANAKAEANTIDIQRALNQRIIAEQQAETAMEAAAAAALSAQSYSSSYSGTSYSSAGSITSIQDIINHESGGDPYATNGQYKGIGQLSESYYETYLGKSWSEVAGDTAAQTKAMNAYIDSRYGGDAGAIQHWNEYGWY